MERPGAVRAWTGAMGAGTTMKLVVNAWCGIQVAALAEVIGTMERGGLDRVSCFKVLGAAPITSPALQGVGILMVAYKYAPMFPISLVEKDFRYVVETAHRLGAATPVSSVTQSVYAKALEHGLGGLNTVGVA